MSQKKAPQASQASQAAKEAHKPIGFWRGWGIACGTAIGSGIFMMPTQLAPFGLLGLLGWVTAGAGAMLIALSLARMARRVPKEGGPYAYAYAGLGKFAGFLIAWSYYFSTLAAVAAIVTAFTSYLSFFLPAIGGSSILALLVSLALVWGLVALNLHGVEGSTAVTFATTVVKIIPIFLMIVVGFTYADTGNLPQWNPSDQSDLSVIGLSTITVMWAFLGLEAATVPADNMVDPKKTIPRVMVASVLTVLVLYFAVSFAVALVMSGDELLQSSSPFADAAQKLMGPAGTALIVGGILVATFSSANANLFISPHTALAASRDHLFPDRFKSLNKRGVPAFGFLVSGGFITLLLMMNYTKGLVVIFTIMVLLSTLSTLLAYAFSAVAELYFLKNEAPTGARTRAILLSLSAFSYSVFAIWGAGADYVMYNFLLLLAGAPIYALLRKE